jgi:hypothetical protein
MFTTSSEYVPEILQGVGEDRAEAVTAESISIRLPRRGVEG